MQFPYVVMLAAVVMTAAAANGQLRAVPLPPTAGIAWKHAIKKGVSEPGLCGDTYVGSDTNAKLIGIDVVSGVKKWTAGIVGSSRALNASLVAVSSIKGRTEIVEAATGSLVTVIYDDSNAYPIMLTGGRAPVVAGDVLIGPCLWVATCHSLASPSVLLATWGDQEKRAEDGEDILTAAEYKQGRMLITDKNKMSLVNASCRSVWSVGKPGWKLEGHATDEAADLIVAWYGLKAERVYMVVNGSTGALLSQLNITQWCGKGRLAGQLLGGRLALVSEFSATVFDIAARTVVINIMLPPSGGGRGARVVGERLLVASMRGRNGVVLDAYSQITRRRLWSSNLTMVPAAAAVILPTVVRADGAQYDIAIGAHVVQIAATSGSVLWTAEISAKGENVDTLTLVQPPAHAGGVALVVPLGINLDTVSAIEAPLM
jgi:hypothetical protein